MGHPGLFFIYFCLFKQALQFLQQIYEKNVHPVYGAGIQTHNLQDMSLLPSPLEQGSCPVTITFCIVSSIVNSDGSSGGCLNTERF